MARPAPPATTPDPPLAPALAVALSAAAWGVFWLPLRAAHGAGLAPGWVTFALYAAPALVLAPLAIVRRARLAAGGRSLAVTGLVGGGAFALYADALLETEVVRALILFYATPIWSTLLERWLLGLRVTGRRLAALALGLAGLAVILGADTRFPVPSNAGDWMGLASGIVWAYAAVRLRSDRANALPELTLAYFALGALVAGALAIALHGGAGTAAGWAALGGEAWWFAAFAVGVFLPSIAAILWGARRLSPGLVGILFMTEISVGTITAALWAGEPFGARELAGVVLVTAAGVVEVFAGRRRARAAPSDL